MAVINAGAGDSNPRPLGELVQELSERQYDHARATSRRALSTNVPQPPDGTYERTVDVKIVPMDFFDYGDPEANEERLHRAELAIAQFMASAEYHSQQHIVGNNLVLIRETTEYHPNDRNQQGGE